MTDEALAESDAVRRLDALWAKVVHATGDVDEFLRRLRRFAVFIEDEPDLSELVGELDRQRRAFVRGENAAEVSSWLHHQPTDNPARGEQRARGALGWALVADVLRHPEGAPVEDLFLLDVLLLPRRTPSSVCDMCAEAVELDLNPLYQHLRDALVAAALAEVVNGTNGVVREVPPAAPPHTASSTYEDEPTQLTAEYRLVLGANPHKEGRAARWYVWFDGNRASLEPQPYRHLLEFARKRIDEPRGVSGLSLGVRHDARIRKITECFPKNAALLRTCGKMEHRLVPEAHEIWLPSSVGR